MASSPGTLAQNGRDHESSMAADAGVLAAGSTEASETETLGQQDAQSNVPNGIQNENGSEQRSSDAAAEPASTGTVAIDQANDQSNSANVVEDAAAAAAVAGASAGSASSAAAAAAAHKKFTSLNVTKQFLQKASPTMSAATANPYGKLASNSLSSNTSRLSTSMPQSRLTAAKLSGTSKPASSGWAPVAPASGTASSPGLSSADPPPAGASQAAPPPRLAALTRSTSPHVRGAEGGKGSPGLRNASLTGRSLSPSTAAIQASKAPWAAVNKAESVSRSTPRMSDFPTTAEIQRAKEAAEARERQQQAQAAARAERALQNLDSFRGTHLESGNRWDDMEDDDFGEVLKFADGTQYKVPTREEPAERTKTPISKEERFKDVSHDRSWPPREATAESRSQASSRAHTNEVQQRQTSSSRRPETMAIHSGEGVSLDAAPSSVAAPRPAWGPRERAQAQSGRREREDGSAKGTLPTHSAPSQTPPAAAPSVRAWGPLAQRQVALNLEAPKPAAPVAAAAPAPSTQTVENGAVKSPAAIAKKPAARTAEEGHGKDPSRARRPSVQEAPSPPVKSPPKPASSPSAPARPSAVRPGPARGLPPHLAARQTQAGTPLAQQPRLGDGERADWESATPRVIAETPKEEPKSKPSPFGAARPANRDATRAADVPEDQHDEMLSAAERARRRRQQEEEERAKEKERARAKAAAIEERMQQQKEAEERKKNEDLAKRQEQQRKTAELREAKAAAKRERKQAAIAGDEQLKPNDVAQRAALLSPSDEAASWRRARMEPSETSPARLGSIEPASQPHADAVARQGPISPQRILLRRPEATQTSALPSVTVSTKDSQAAEQKESQIPTAPRADRLPNELAPPRGPSSSFASEQRPHKVEILAPTDKGAAQHMWEQERDRKARQKAGATISPPSAMRPAPKAPDALKVLPEPLQTKSEVEFDPAPVWNKFKVKLGRPRPRERLRHAEFKAQQARVALAKDQSIASVPAALLTWNPPIVNLPTRTLSRDDMLFPKKYRKGIVISTLSLPKRTMEALAKDRRSEREALQTITASVPNAAEASAIPYVKVPNSIAHHSEQGPNARSGRGRRDSRSAVAFARGDDPLARLTPSPVSFMLGSELANEATGKYDGEGLTQRSLSKSSAALPSPGRVSSTWGQSSLTFAGLEPQAVSAPEEQNHIKKMWAQPSTNSSRQALPSQNSLRGIADEVPAAMSMSMQDLRTDDIPATEEPRTTQYQDVGINTASSAPISRVYSPVGNSAVLDVNALTAASSPLVAQQANDELSLNAAPTNSSRARSQSPSQLRMDRKDVTSTTLPGQQGFLHQERGGASAAFGPYAYPNTTAGYQALQGAMNSQHGYGAGAYSNGRGGFMSNESSHYGSQRGRGMNSMSSGYNSAFNGYSNRMSDYNAFTPGLADMSAAALGASLSGNSFSGAGWPLESSGFTYGSGGLGNSGFGSQSAAFDQHASSAYRQMPTSYQQGRSTSSYHNQQYSRGNYQQQQYNGGAQSSFHRGNGYRGQYDGNGSSSITPSGMHATAKPFRYGGSASSGRGTSASSYGNANEPFSDTRARATERTPAASGGVMGEDGGATSAKGSPTRGINDARSGNRGDEHRFRNAFDAAASSSARLW